MNKFLHEATAQWRNLAVEVRSVRSMLEEVISNWEKYSSTVATLQAWLEDGEQMLNQSEGHKRVRAKTWGTRCDTIGDPPEVLFWLSWVVCRVVLL